MQASPVSHVQTAAVGQSATAGRADSDDGFDFWDFLDIINPLQHLPIISQIYRAVTGDEIDPAARLIGGGLYGLGLLGTGWIGLAADAINVAVEEATGDDIPGHLIELAFGDGSEGGDAAVAEGGGASGDGTGASGDADAALMAAASRPAAMVVRSDPLADAPSQPMFAAADAGETAGLAAASGAVMSPATSQALLFAAQSGDPELAEAVNRMLPRGQSRPDRVSDMGDGLFGYSLDDVPVQVGRGVTRDASAGLFSAAGR